MSTPTLSKWMFYTPEFQLVIVLVSSPLALLVALWGMTSKATLQLMKSSQERDARGTQGRQVNYTAE